ncbi:MAG TPA: hypothetical protein VJM82_06145 [Nitrospiraceae bacterium]|nr:hypothetical protein [Nitrospiraceae bacterium]
MRHTGTLVMIAMLSFGLVTLSSTVEPILADSSKTMAMPEQIVKGDVLMTEGEFYIVKDITGHEVRLHVNKDTKMDGKVKVGDKIEARVTPEGHASSITLQILQNGAAPVVPSRPDIPSTVLQGSAR